MSRHASFSYIKETCPDVDRICNDTAEAIKKEVTLPFREALIEACDRIEELEGENDDLTDRIKELEGEVSDLEDTIKSLEKERTEVMNG